MPTGASNLTIQKRKAILRDINNSIFDCLFVRGDDSEIEKKISEESIQNVKILAKTYNVSGLGILCSGIGIGGTVGAIGAFEAGTALYAVATTSAVISTAIAAPVFFAIGGILTLAIGSLFGYKLFQKGRTIMKEPKIRKSLNKMIEDALNYFQKDDYANFFLKLAETYGDKDPLIEFIPNETIDIQPKHIVKQLLAHGFRPDGIAYLMNIIGEALVRYKVDDASSNSRSEYVSISIKLFKATYETEIKISDNPAVALKEEANKLDKQVNKLKQKNKNIFEEICSKFATTFQIPNEYIVDFEKAPFTKRLEDMTIITRINCAMCYIILNDMEQAKRLLIGVKNSFKDIVMFEKRIKALEDWLFALGLYEDAEYDMNVKITSALQK